MEFFRPLFFSKRAVFAIHFPKSVIKSSNWTSRRRWTLSAAVMISAGSPKRLEIWRHYFTGTLIKSLVVGRAKVLTSIRSWSSTPSVDSGVDFACCNGCTRLLKHRALRKFPKNYTQRRAFDRICAGARIKQNQWPIIGCLKFQRYWPYARRKWTATAQCFAHRRYQRKHFPKRPVNDQPIWVSICPIRESSPSSF